MAARLHFTPNSEHQAQIVETWAHLEGRPTSGLLAFLLEVGLATAEREGMMPQPVADALRFRSKR